jgi:hypothetical protein
MEEEADEPPDRGPSDDGRQHEREVEVSETGELNPRHDRGEDTVATGPNVTHPLQSMPCAS